MVQPSVPVSKVNRSVRGGRPVPAPPVGTVPPVSLTPPAPLAPPAVPAPLVPPVVPELPVSPAAPAPLVALPASQVSSEQAAAYLGVTKSTLGTWRCTGRYAIPFVKAGSKVRYRKSDLDTFLEQRTATNSGEAGLL